MVLAMDPKFHHIIKYRRQNSTHKSHNKRMQTQGENSISSKGVWTTLSQNFYSGVTRLSTYSLYFGL